MAFLSTRSLLSALAFCLSTTATSSVNGHVFLPFSKLTNRHHAASAQLSPRAEGAVGAKLTSNTFAYVVTASIGTPPQSVSLIVNPSVGDTWVPDATAYDCAGTSRYRYCDAYEANPSLYDPSDWADNSPTCVEGYVNSSGACRWGMYSTSKSSTYLPANAQYKRFSQSTVEGTSVSGSNFTDKIAVGEIELDDYPMGLVSDADRYIGMLGLGRNSSSGGSYVNFIDRLVQRGSIKSPAYSIWLDDAEGSSGNLLFGAIDKSRYEGELIRISARDSLAYYRSFGVALASINGTKEKSGESMPAIRSNDFPVAATISPGEVLSYLPDTIVDSIAAMVGAEYYSPYTGSSSSLMTIPCDAGTRDNSTVNFVLQLGGEGGPVLNVKTSDLVLPLSALPSTLSYSQRKIAGKCVFGIQKWPSSKDSNYYTTYYNIGSSLLRRSYLVFDVVNREVAIAPTKFGSQSASVIETFGKRGAVVPSSKAFGGLTSCDYDDSDGSCSNRSGSGSSSSGSSGSYGMDTDLGPPHWKRIALGVGITFGLLILISVIAAVVVCNRLRKGKKDKAKEVVDEEASASGADVPASGATVTPVQDVSQTASQVPAVSVTPPPPVAQPRQADIVSTDEPRPEAAQAMTEEQKGKGKEVDRSA